MEEIENHWIGVQLDKLKEEFGKDFCNFVIFGESSFIISDGVVRIDDTKYHNILKNIENYEIAIYDIAPSKVINSFNESIHINDKDGSK